MKDDKMATIKLTATEIKNLPKPETKHAYYFDSVLERFGVVVYASGRISYFIKYTSRGRQKWYTFGRFPILTPDKARKLASILLGEIDAGGDPNEKKKQDRNAITMAQLCDWYFEEGVGHKQASTIANDKGRVNTLIIPLIGDIPAKLLTSGDIIAMMNDIIKGDKIKRYEKSDKPRGRRIVNGGPGAAARTIQTLGAIMTFAKQQGIRPDNPVNGIKKPKDNVRDVFLTWDEVKKFGQLLATPEVYKTYPQACNILKLYLLTGCRRAEILTLRWEYIDFENQVFRFPHTKSGRQTRPFGTAALKILQSIKRESGTEKSGWVFPSSRGDCHTTSILKTLKKIMQTTKDGKLILNKPDITNHALRHTFVSLGADMGYSDIILAAIVGHRLGTITNRYTHTVDATLVSAANAISLKLQEHLDAGKANANK